MLQHTNELTLFDVAEPVGNQSESAINCEGCEDCPHYDHMNGECKETVDEDDLCPVVSGKVPFTRLKILNLYAGIGGNRELWAGCDVTAVEYDGDIAGVYAKRFPQDTVITGDALEYVQTHYSNFDFIWASPPCPTHGQYRHNVGVIGKGFNPVIPEMTSLYGLIVFLQTYFKGLWVVENVKPYYKPLIAPSFELHRHLFWSNFSVGQRAFKKAEIRSKNKIADFDFSELVKNSAIKNKRQVLRNCVDGELGLHILDGVTKIFGKQKG